MKSYKQKFLITLMKIISISFVLLMSLFFIQIISSSNSNGGKPLTDEEIEEKLNSSIIKIFRNPDQNERSYSFHGFVFVLGAFWNSKILKVGII